MTYKEALLSRPDLSDTPSECGRTHQNGRFGSKVSAYCENFASQNYPWKSRRQQDPQWNWQNSRGKNSVVFLPLRYWSIFGFKFMKELYHIQLSTPGSSGRRPWYKWCPLKLFRACRTVHKGLLRIICNNRRHTMRKSELKPKPSKEQIYILL